MLISFEEAIFEKVSPEITLWGGSWGGDGIGRAERERERERETRLESFMFVRSTVRHETLVVIGKSQLDVETVRRSLCKSGTC